MLLLYIIFFIFAIYSERASRRRGVTGEPKVRCFGRAVGEALWASEASGRAEGEALRASEESGRGVTGERRERASRGRGVTGDPMELKKPHRTAEYPNLPRMRLRRQLVH